MRYSYDRKSYSRSTSRRATALTDSDKRTLDISVHNSTSYAERALKSIQNHTATPGKICVIIAAYNEELVLKHTIESAVAAGMKPSDIYVVDDCSVDKTSVIANSTIGKCNVLRVDRSGKGLALATVIRDLKLTKRYEWVHIADADGEFDEHYFSELHTNLDPSYAAATGYMTSLPGSYVSNYRAFEYTMAMDVARRYQTIFNMIPVIPGPTSVFRSDVLEQLDFTTGSLCEDFDVTLQIHEKGLGKIQFIETAIARTQDPHNLRNYVKQITRWNRGNLQLFVRNKMWRRPSKVNSFITYQITLSLFFTFVYTILLPYVTIMTGNFYFLAVFFLSDVAAMLAYSYYAAMRTKRYETLASFPLTYSMRWLQLLIFAKCYIEVVVLRKHRLTGGTWETVVRQKQRLAS